MHYIIGLGNPGEKYQGTRHNVGRDILLWLATQHSWGEWQKDKNSQALRISAQLSGPINCLLPETYMNRSGETVGYLQKKENLQPDQLIVIYDDVDLAIGELKISAGRGSGGHNGIESIIKALKTKDFVRIRIGVSPRSFWSGKVKRPRGAQLSDHVLQQFSRSEKAKLETVYEEAGAALECLVKEGVGVAMNTFNTVS